ncbi:hypothetical protein PSV3_00105 [Septimatrevirus PSV32]|uniref:Terminase large subunit n=1 Tax=Pseudomonas phage PSV3 TaxID=3003632 RepID=A0AAE9VW11_9CAUD|nr:terminase large subunit [Pseudomonas phage PSV3]WBF76807.1 hypothetical protein PSV3_00105 [Pseudomonas phage PSV3]
MHALAIDTNGAKPVPYEVVFKPLPGSQTIALCSMAAHTLYEGARGPGKTLTQLMRFYRNVGKGYGKFWRGVIFDLEFDHLGGLVAESKKWFGDNGKLKDGGKFYESTSAYKWVWPTGEELLFRHVKKLSDYEGFHGHEYPFIGWNELTKHPSGDLYDKFMSVNRCTFDPIKDTPKDPKTGRYLTPNGEPLPPVKCEVFSTTNPSGPGHNWVKRRFITIARALFDAERRTAAACKVRSIQHDEPKRPRSQLGKTSLYHNCPAWHRSSSRNSDLQPGDRKRRNARN